MQFVAAAAASAIVASSVAAQTQAGGARQTPADAGGLFSELLGELLQDVQAALTGQASQDAIASPLSTDPTQQGAADASTTGQAPDAWMNALLATQQSSANGQTDGSTTPTGSQSDWLSSWMAAFTQQMQQTQQSASGQPTGTSPLAALEAFLQNQGTSSNTQSTGDTQNASQTPTQDASLLPALQSLMAQFAQQQQTAQPVAQSSADATSATAASTPPNAQLAAMLQTLMAEASAMSGAQSGAAQAAATDTQQTSPADNAGTANGTPTKPSAQFAQAAPQQGSTPAAVQAPSVPTHFNPGSGGSNTPQNQTGQHNANMSASGGAPSQSPSNGSTDAASGNTNVPTFLQVAHDQSLAQQNGATTTAAAQTNAVNAIAATTPAQAPTQPVAATLQVGPATPQTSTPDVHALAVSIATQSQAGSKQFNIRIDPPELGRVDVRLTVDSTGKAQAHLAVDKPQTLELLQKDSGNLARALKDSGVQLGNNGLQFSLKGQGRNSDGSRGSTPRGRSLSVTAVASTTPSQAASSSAYSVSASGVDIRV